MKRFAILSCVILAASTTMSKGAEERPISVSIIRLIATPKEYAGKRVQITGFLHLEFEGNGIYLHRDDYEHLQYKNGLWIDVTEESAKILREANDHYVLLEGTFDPNRGGHMGLWSGTLTQIKHAKIWADSPHEPKN